jgi:hypothetical protein
VLRAAGAAGDVEQSEGFLAGQAEAGGVLGV